VQVNDTSAFKCWAHMLLTRAEQNNISNGMRCPSSDKIYEPGIRVEHHCTSRELNKWISAFFRVCERVSLSSLDCLIHIHKNSFIQSAGDTASTSDHRLCKIHTQPLSSECTTASINPLDLPGPQLHPSSPIKDPRTNS